MNGTKQDSSTLQEELDALLQAAQEEPGVSELLEIVNRVNEDSARYGVEVNEIRIVGSTSTVDP